MANNITDTLIEERIDEFRSAFKRAKELFRDENKQNKLSHPGEFGTYREDIVRDFLHSFLPQRLAIDTGFIVNALEEVSGQIDLIIYDPSLTPPLESKNRQRFFPVETVIAAGEVKSDVNRDQFTDALIRLSKVKEMRSTLTDEASAVVRWYALGNTEYDPDKIPFDQVFTFLICNRIAFPLHNVFFPSTLNDIYKSVDYAHRHSSILSLEDGLLHYTIELPEGGFADSYFPIVPAGKGANRNKWIWGHDDDYAHFKVFCSHLFMHAAHCTVGSVNLMEYANLGKRNHLVEKPKSDK